MALLADPAYAESAADAGVGASWFLSDTGLVVLFLPGLIAGGPGAGTFPCDTGDFTLAIDDRPPVGVISPGDTVTITFGDCAILVNEAFEVALTYNGTISCVVNRALETASSYDFAFAFTFTGLEIGVDVAGEREETLSVDGDLAVEAFSPDGTMDTTTMRTGSLSVTMQARTETFSRVITDYHVVEESNLDTEDFSREMAGTVFDQAIGGPVTVQTTVLATGTGFDPGFPATGEMLVTSPGAWPVAVIPRDNIRVLLEIDEDADGDADIAVPTTWSDLNWFISRDLIRSLLIL